MKQLTENQKKDFCDKAIALETDIRGVYLTMGAMLYRIREEQLYEPYWSGWHEFCMEFKDLSGSAISKMITVYDVFVKRFGYSPEHLIKVGGWTKLYELTLHIKTKRDAEKWLNRASELSRTDLSRELVESKTGISQQTCKHKETYYLRICGDCGLRERLEEIPKGLIAKNGQNKA